MEIVKIGTNTKNADGIKLNREIRTAFEKYLKAKQKLDESNFKDITVEMLYASWLATFKDSEDYKKTMEAKEAKDNEATNNRNQKRENRKNSIKAQYIEAGMSEEDAERYAAIAVNTKKKTTKKTTEQKEKN
jgi:hypothetical protein